MGTKSTSKHLTLADIASRTDSSGKTLEIIEVLAQDNPILEDAPVIEANQTEGHKSTVRTGLPKPTWRKMYKGVQPSKSTTATVVETLGNLEAYSEVDVDVVKMNGGTKEARFQEDKAFLEAMSQEMAETVFYGDLSKTPEKFEGLCSRLSDKKAKSGEQIILAGGTTGKLTSCYFVGWGEGCKLLTPKGQPAGLQSSDKGQLTLTLEDGSKMEAFVTHYKWMLGLSVSDWRAISRVANIPLDDLNTNSGVLANGALINFLIDAKNRIHKKYRGRCVLYVPTEVLTYLEKAAIEKSHNALKIVEAAGQFQTYFFNIPIKACDAISLNETAVKAANATKAKVAA